MFGIFKFAVFLSSNIVNSLDIVQRERFCNERSRHKYDLQIDTDKSESKRFPLWFLDEISWFLKYNQNGFLYLLVFVLNSVYIIYGVITQTIYSFLPNDRDSLTGQYTNPILNALESVYLVNHLENSRLFNKLFALNLLQMLILRFRFVRKKLKNSQVNRYRYKEINIIQMYLTYADELVSDWRGWLKFFSQ